MVTENQIDDGTTQDNSNISFVYTDKLLNVPTKRINMGKCNHIYGKVMVFIAVETVAYNRYS